MVGCGSVGVCVCARGGGELMTDCRGVSPADSPCTGQNAETRSNGAPLGRALMLFLTPVLNMPGAAGFSAQASLPSIQYGRQMQSTGWMGKKCDRIPRRFLVGMFVPRDIYLSFILEGRSPSLSCNL